MCFSPEVDLISGLAVTTIGVDGLRHGTHPNERALAALPLIFGVHQILEAFVWWGVESGSAGTDRLAWAYLAIAFGLIPWFVPWAVRRIEPDPGRRRFMAGFTVLGALVATVLMLALVGGPVEVADGGTYLSYSVPLTFGGALVAGYVAATCGSVLLSSDRWIAWFGIANLAAAIGLAVLLSTGVISLWCVWAAVTSIVIAVHFRRTDGRRHSFRPVKAVG